jgi:hypothetical protein
LGFSFDQAAGLTNAIKHFQKEQIRINVLGFGWKDLHHPWSKDGVDYSPEELIIPEQSSRDIPAMPTMELPSRKETKQLGTRTVDVDELDLFTDFPHIILKKCVFPINCQELPRPPLFFNQTLGTQKGAPRKNVRFWGAHPIYSFK